MYTLLLVVLGLVKTGNLRERFDEVYAAEWLDAEEETNKKLTNGEFIMYYFLSHPLLRNTTTFMARSFYSQ
jgi:hypothetical protein